MLDKRFFQIEATLTIAIVIALVAILIFQITIMQELRIVQQQCVQHQSKEDKK